MGNGRLPGIVHAREAHNWYQEPIWVSRRLFEVEQFTGKVVDPAAGAGRIVESARSARLEAEGFDVIQRAPDIVKGGRDFFAMSQIYKPNWPNIVSNPPYGRCPEGKGRLEDRFVRRALHFTTGKVAVFLRSNWINGEKRSRWIEQAPLYRVYYCTPRPSCPPGGMDVREGGGTEDYCWFVFLHGFDGHHTGHWLRRDP
ncbi:MAG: hypothetical protein AAFQ51_05395 [Pseudomonadota bacterium]